MLEGIPRRARVYAARTCRPSRTSCPAQAAQAEHPQAGGAGGEDRQARDQRHHAGRDDHQFRRARAERSKQSVARRSQGDEAMKLPKFVQAWVDPRDGRAYYYLRRRGRPRVRLSGLPWSPSFMAAYEAAMSGPRTAIGAGRIKPGSVAAVVAEYLDSQTFFTSKSAGTQRMRRGILERFRAAYGDRPMALLPPEWHAARSWRATLRSLCQFALKRRYRRDDPTANIKLRAIKGDGFHCWTDAEIAQFEAHHSIGTKPRLALALLLYTTQRRSDVVRMGRQHIRETPDGPAL